MMKYVVIMTSPSSSEELFIFPSMVNHADMTRILKKEYPGLIVVSAGMVSNYRETFESKHGGEFPVDQIRLGGESITLKIQSRPEDIDIFNAMATGY